ncbi:type B DNA-directed DNA polymerase [Salinirubellus salinus]|uniref:DNA-directed DNA polymerase n=1 Tax=Salinirubellus salinus TaxID=1364945 RepID=A0A9E7R085_9EURY|nr:type B DNA-directed DNA polymerase [Salinirubellus salinus]UWM53261.1 type B DNA-directed DNA polymerase [Salinirubellus salinus]
MPFKIDHRDGAVLAWSLTDDGARPDRDTDYRPTVSVAHEDGDTAALDRIRPHVADLPAVTETRYERWRRGFRHDAERVLRADVRDVDRVLDVARTVAGWGAPGTYRLFGVDHSREFRYCLDRGLDPTPERELSVLELRASEVERARDGGPREVELDGETLTGDPADLAATVEERVHAADPDVLSVSGSDLLAGLHERAAEQGRDYRLGRVPGFQQLAGRSTYSSYGRVGHSPARYNVPGRVVLDHSNTFLLSAANLAGALDLVGRSWKPLQELAWASIGTVLTAIQIRAARERGVLVPWRAWRPELFKTARQLHTADRGGFTFAPDVGVHESVHELDFASLYPNVIVTRNVSPETVRCACHRGREDVPELGYAICDADGYLPEVLEPLVTDRAEVKAELAETTDPDRREVLQGQADAIKWILVSCFGYQGFKNAKFGRIEAHEAINAYARDVMLTAKERLEAGGWRVVHGIVDSVWVTEAEDATDPTPLRELARDVSEEVRIELEYEAEYDWVAFVPRREGAGGALTKYFGRVSGDERTFKYRGIECRQDGTSPFVADAQRDLIRAFDRTRSPEAVCDRLARHLETLRAGDVPPDELTIVQRVSKPAEEYDRATRNAAALERAERAGLPVHPGQRVRYVVADDDADSVDRVRLAHESPDRYDADCYAARLVRAAESVLSPLGWDESRIRRRLAGTRDARLGSF